MSEAQEPASRQPTPPFPPTTLRKLTLIAVVGCGLGVVGAAVGLIAGAGAAPWWSWGGFALLLTILGLWNLRTHRQLVVGEHWTQATNPGRP